MKKILYAFVILNFTSLIAFAQVSTVWEKRYNGTGAGYDNAASVAVDAAGNVYVAGTSTGAGSGYDYVVIKYNSSGSTDWVARYNGTGNGEDNAYLVRVDNSGNVYVSGSSTGTGTGLDYAIVKYNSAGVQQWAARYNGPGNAVDEVYSLQVDNIGNVYITGYSNGGATMDDIATIKYNSAGAEQWVRRYNGSANNDDYGNSLVLDAAGNPIVTCASTETASDIDFLTIKYDASGNQQWTAFYNGPGNDEDFPSSNTIDAAGNFYVVGYSVGIGTERDYCIVKYNSSGQQQWASRYDGPDGWDEAFNVVVDNSGNVYITGNSAGVGTGDDYCTIKYNSSGAEQWVARYNGSGASNDYSNWVAVDPTGNVYVTGIIWDGIGNPENIATIGYNSAGVQQWVQIYNGPGNEFDSGNALAIDNLGNVYVTGGSDNPNNTDFITIKYSSTIGIQQISSEIPNKFSLEQNYPNPFNPGTKIKFHISKSSDVKMVVYDVSGKTLETLVSEHMSAGTYEVDFNAVKLPTGVYFYKLVTNDFSETKKMILVK
jgi:uncharacterized delta-60 repeat protein